MYHIICYIDVGDFRKQQKEELSHWKEWKYWVHGRAVESHDFEERLSLEPLLKSKSYMTFNPIYAIIPRTS